jgi:surface protein
MTGMFQNCSKLTQLDVSDWDTSKVTALTPSIFKPRTLLLNWSIEEINRFVTTDITAPSIVYVKHDISKLTQNNKITYVNYIGDEISISLPQPLRRIGNICDRLYWDYDKGCYCIEQNIDINENNELCIIEPIIIELTDMNEKVEIDVYETTKIGFIDTPIDPTETIINQDMINYKIEQLESSTEYTIQFNCLAKIKENNIGIKINEEVIETPITLGINRVKITTPSNITDKTRIALYGEGNIIKDVMLVKGDLNQDLKYFEGIQGLGELQEDGSYKITIVSDNYNWLWKE